MKAPGFAKLNNIIDPRAFMRGLVVVGLIYTMIFIWLGLTAGQTVKDLEKRLSSATVQIEYTGLHSPLSQPQTEHHGDLHPKDLLEGSPVEDIEDMPPQPNVPENTAETEHHEPAHHEVPQQGALAPAPIAEVTQDTPQGKLPKIAASGLTPFEAYKKPSPFLGNVPVAAIVLTDYGLSESLSQDALSALPAEITVALSPYAPDAEKLQQHARSAGHEIWLELPSENTDFPQQDPGPMAIMAAESLNYNQEKLLSVMAVTSGYAGIYAYTDERLLSARLLFQNLLKAIFDRGLGYFEGNPEGPLMVEDMAASNDAPYARNGFIITQDADAFWPNVTQAAKDQSYAVVSLKATPENIESLKVYILKLRSSGIHLVPLSYIARPHGNDGP